MSWVAAFFTLAGVVLLARKRRVGWVVCVVGNVLWISYALATRQWPILMLDGVFLVVNALGWRAWGNGGK